MKIKLFFLSILFFVTTDSSAQIIESAQSFGTWTNEETNGLAHDSQGNYYVVGYNSFGISFGAITFEKSGSYIVKFASNGNVLWAKNIADPISTSVDVVVDSDDNVYWMGAYHYDIEIDGVPLTGSNGSAANGDRTFIAKFDSNGVLEIAKKIEISGSLPGSANASAIAIDKQDNFYLLGDADRAFVIDGVKHTEQTSDISFLIKFNPEGEIGFVKIIRPTNRGVIGFSDIATSQESVYIVGYLQGEEMNFGGLLYTNTHNGPTAFASKFDFDGNPQWVNTFQEGEASKYCSVVTDDNGDLYTLGNNISFDTGYLYTHLITKMSADGTTHYIKKLDQENDDLCNSIYSYGNKIGGLATHNNNLYYSGGFKGTFQSNDIQYNSSNKNISILKFNEFGYTQWIKTFEGTKDDRSTAISIYNNKILTAGVYTSPTLDFNDNVINNNSGNSNTDIFVVTGLDTTSNKCPQLDYFLQHEGDTLCLIDSLQLKIQTESEEDINHEWFKDGISYLKGIGINSIWVKEPGLYTIKYNINSICEYNSIPITVSTVCGDTNSGTNNLISIGPNPASNYLNFIFPMGLKFKVIIYNSIGQMVGQADTPQVMDIEYLANGSYFLKITKEDGSFLTTKKLLKFIL